jgi:hypothetical protein
MKNSDHLKLTRVGTTPILMLIWFPVRNIVIKVEKVHDNHYVAHFPDGAERVNKKTVSGWTCQGRWIETAAIAQPVLQ